MDDIHLIAGEADPVIADYAAWAAPARTERVTLIAHPNVCKELKECVELHSSDDFSKTHYLSTHSHDRIASIVLFLNREMTPRNRALLETIAELAVEQKVECICIISSFRVHFGDPSAKGAEDFVINRLKGSSTGIVVFRPSHILSPHSRMNQRLRTFRFLAPLVPARFTTTCLEGEELFTAISQELDSFTPHKRRTYTLLGTNIPWTDLLGRKRIEHPPGTFASAIAAFLQLLLLGQLIGLLVDLLVRMLPVFRTYAFDTLYPSCVQELLALYNKYNHRNVKIVGYNNGVIHFGHNYSGKTVVSTIRCNRSVRVYGDLARFDAGVTVRQAMEVLKREGKELHVIPNYSYVSMGTAFFIPIHGSASTYSTIGETIEKVVLFDPAADRFIAVRKSDPDFGKYYYNLAADVLLLRLTVRVREKALYYVKNLGLANPSSAELLSYFHDEKPSNVEMRKAVASSEAVRVSLYYTERREGDAASLDLPRDKLGSIWDRLESNPITSILFHGLIRRLAYHVELFLSEKDFAVFWETHRTLPLSKIQLRYIKRDGMPHSPFRQHDCVSADLFMLKKHKKTFDAYLKATLPSAALNPGKHSR